jgi:hypothetical protein
VKAHWKPLAGALVGLVVLIAVTLGVTGGGVDTTVVSCYPYYATAYVVLDVTNNGATGQVYLKLNWTDTGKIVAHTSHTLTLRHGESTTITVGTYWDQPDVGLPPGGKLRCDVVQASAQGV